MLRQLTQCRALRSLCYAIVLALVTNLLPGLFTKPASAQLMAQYSVGVVDFSNESGVQGDLLARLATDAVVVEMSKTSRYDVSTTRSQMKEQMDKLDLRPPLTKLGLIRLGEELSADAMLTGTIKAVQLTGSGATRKASVILAVQMVDQASGEVVNGSIQTGISSARVAYVPDDDSLITEAINNAAFLCVKAMVDYIIPEATIQLNIGSDQVMLNKGARDGIKPGMNMIILRQKDIIGYIRVTGVDPTDSYAKVTKTLRGIQPEDKARAIFEMPVITTELKSEPLPSSAPKSGGGGGSFSKIGKFLLGLAIVVGFATFFKGGRGSESSQRASGGQPMTISWNPDRYNHGQPVMELLILRDGLPFKSLRSPTAIDSPPTSLLTTIAGQPYYGDGGASYTINYYNLSANPSTTPPVPTDQVVNEEPFGTPHEYNIRVTYQQVPVDGTSTTTQYFYTPLSNYIVATAIERVKRDDVTDPNLRYDPNDIEPPAIYIPQLVVGSGSEDVIQFEWNAKPGADVYQMTLKPAPGNTGPTWTSQLIYTSGGSRVVLPVSQQNALASILANPAFAEQVMIWRVDARRQADTSKAWVVGEDNYFRISGSPPGTP